MIGDLLRLLDEGKPVVCPSDQISSPSYGPDVAKAVVMLVEQERSGLVHVAGEIVTCVSFDDNRTALSKLGVCAGIVAPLGSTAVSVAVAVLAVPRVNDVPDA